MRDFVKKHVLAELERVRSEIIAKHGPGTETQDDPVKGPLYEEVILNLDEAIAHIGRIGRFGDEDR